MKWSTYLYGYLVMRNELSFSGSTPPIRAARGCALLHTFHLHAHARRVPEIENQLRFVRRVRLSMKIPKVTTNRRCGDPKGTGDAFVLQPTATECQNIVLAMRELDTARQRCNGLFGKRRQ